MTSNLSVASLRCVPLLNGQENIRLSALQGTAPMQVGGNKNANNRPVGVDGKRDWTFGLFDCFDRCGLCTYLKTDEREPLFIH
jgi:hypothetical protein